MVIVVLRQIVARIKYISKVRQLCGLVLFFIVFICLHSLYFSEVRFFFFFFIPYQAQKIKVVNLACHKQL